MGYAYYNPNPANKNVGDCVIRAISKAMDWDWEKTYCEIALQGYIMSDMPSANYVWGAVLRNNGFKKYILPDTCPDCYSIQEFCAERPNGTYVIATGSHVVTIIDGNYYDTWDSGDETPIYYYKKEASK